MPRLALKVPYNNLILYARADDAPVKPGDQNPAPPALSPSAIVGLAILGAVFLTVLLAAVLRLCYSPSPQESNPASIYRPDDSNVTQLARMKQVRDFNREAAWERAQMCEIESEVEDRASSMSGKRASRNIGGRSPGQAPEKRRAPRQDPVPGRRGSADWAITGGVERVDRRDRAWRARMAMTAMEASGQVEMPEHLDLRVKQAGPGYAGEGAALSRQSALFPPPMTKNARHTVDYEEDYAGSAVKGKTVEGTAAGEQAVVDAQKDERIDVGDSRRHTVPLIAGSLAEEGRASMVLW